MKSVIAITVMKKKEEGKDEEDKEFYFYKDRIILSKDVWILNRVEELVSFPPNEIYYFVLFRCIETTQKHNFTTFREFP